MNVERLSYSMCPTVPALGANCLYTSADESHVATPLHQALGCARHVLCKSMPKALSWRSIQCSQRGWLTACLEQRGRPEQ